MPAYTSDYPSGLDSFIDTPVEGQAGALEFLGRLGNAVEKIEAELGLNPSGSFTDLVTRLAALGAGNELLYIRWSGATVPLRNTVTSDAARTVHWIGPVFPPAGGGYAVAGVDIASKVVT